MLYKMVYTGATLNRDHPLMTHLKTGEGEEQCRNTGDKRLHCEGLTGRPGHSLAVLRGDTWSLYCPPSLALELEPPCPR